MGVVALITTPWQIWHKEERKMKEKYTSPIITCEELAKADVLCASNEQQDIDNQFLQSQGLLDYVFSGDWAG